jgi:hypothetical protein
MPMNPACSARKSREAWRMRTTGYTTPTRYSRTTTERGTPTSQRIRGMMIS